MNNISLVRVNVNMLFLCANVSDQYMLYNFFCKMKCYFVESQINHVIIRTINVLGSLFACLDMYGVFLSQLFFPIKVLRKVNYAAYHG